MRAARFRPTCAPSPVARLLVLRRSRYLCCCALGGRPFDCADGASASGGEVILSLARNGMAASARTPVLPEPTLVRALPAQLRRTRPRSAMSASRRFKTSLKRLECANCGHSLRTCRTGQFDPLQSFLFSPETCGEGRKADIGVTRGPIPAASSSRVSGPRELAMRTGMSLAARAERASRPLAPRL